MSEHSTRRARTFTARNEGGGFLVGVIALAILAGIVGFVGGMNIPFATYMGWGAAYAGSVGFIFAVYLYAIRRMRGRHDHATFAGIGGFIVMVIIESRMPFGSAILNFASGSDFFGWLVNILVGVLLLMMLVVGFANVKRTDVR